MKLLALVLLLGSTAAFAQERTWPSAPTPSNGTPVNNNICGTFFPSVKAATAVCAKYGFGVLSDAYGIGCDCASTPLGNTGHYGIPFRNR